MKFEDDEINTRGLDNIVKALKKKVAIRVGILSDTAARDGKLNNATIGAFHEFGTSRIPQRSFLRIPLLENLDKYLKSMLPKDFLKSVTQEKSFVTLMKEIGVIGERVVQDAFASGGFGKWPPWQNSSYQNNAGQLLVDTGQLRDSITSDVKENA